MYMEGCRDIIWCRPRCQSILLRAHHFLSRLPGGRFTIAIEPISYFHIQLLPTSSHLVHLSTFVIMAILDCVNNHEDNRGGQLNVSYFLYYFRVVRSSIIIDLGTGGNDADEDENNWLNWKFSRQPGSASMFMSTNKIKYSRRFKVGSKFYSKDY